MERKHPITLASATPTGILLAAGLLAALAIAPAASAATVNLTASDGFGASSFNSAGSWSDGLAPHSGADYVDSGFDLRTPGGSGNYTFGGDSLELASGGYMMYKGTGATNTYTINDLNLNGGFIRSGAGSGNTMVLAGNINVSSGSTTSEIKADQSPYQIDSTITGTGALLIDSTNANGYAVTLNGTNTYTGNLEIGSNAATGATIFSSTSGWAFVIGANGTNNSISGVATGDSANATAQFDGAFNINLTGADNTIGDSWSLASVPNQTFGTTFSVAGFTNAGSGLWTEDANGVTYQFSTATGNLTTAAVPEPVTLTLFGVSAASLLLLRGKRAC